MFCSSFASEKRPVPVRRPLLSYQAHFSWRRPRRLRPVPSNTDILFCVGLNRGPNFDWHKPLCHPIASPGTCRRAPSRWFSIISHWSLMDIWQSRWPDECPDRRAFGTSPPFSQLPCSRNSSLSICSLRGHELGVLMFRELRNLSILSCMSRPG